MPFRDSTLGYVLMGTTICFVADALKTFHESFRVLGKRGIVIIGMLDRASHQAGRECVEQKRNNPLYRHARFYSEDEVTGMLGCDSLKVERYARYDRVIDLAPVKTELVARV